MRIAIIESNIIWEDKKANLSKLESILEDLNSQDNKADIILLPEMSFTGFSMNTKLTAESGEIVSISELAAKFQTAIAFGYVKALGEGVSENHYAIINKAGEMIHDYAKIHPFSYSDENKYFVGGNTVSVSKFMDFNIGTAICYDLRFPEVFQAMSDTADMIIVPANWPEKRRDHFMTLAKARAIENQCFIAAVNCRGEIGGLTYSGDSMLIAPDGAIVNPEQSMEIANDRLYIYEVENNVSAVRDAFPMKKDRKNELYIQILKK